MKNKTVLLTALALALAFPASLPSMAFAAEAPLSVQASGTTIDNVPNAHAGGKVTISGTTNAAEVLIKVLNPDQTVLFFDIVPSSGGKFQDTFTLPATAAVGRYQVVAGQGSDIASSSFKVVSSVGSTTPTDPSTPTDPTDPSTPGDNTGTNPADPSTVQVKFTLADIPAPVGGIVTLDASTTSAPKLEALLPVAGIRSLGNNGLRLLLPGGSLTLPKEVIAGLAALAGSDNEATVSLQLTTLTSSEEKAALTQAGASGAGLTPQGGAFELALSVVMKDGTTKKLSTFDKPVLLQFRLAANTDDRLAGIYYLSDGGAITYIGGDLKDRTLTAAVSHFSSYGVFTYMKTYTDVPSTYWAANVIQELTAKHIVQGISNDKFGPAANVTRAEFTTMLVRALGLKPAAASPFSDVPAGSWYAEAAEAAFENGIVTGTDASKFEPNKPITREELAAMIIRVYAKQDGSANAAGSETDLAAFKDAAAISSWAKAEVASAVHVGLMQGSGSLFSPRGNATRAEAAQVLVNLLFGA
ncbi:hypothetical protein GZH47_07575 [Paenibacillus rhizovicinus]|uniref:SLH domain-containing protein n=1 Tax=Paenibacillus rhizovicinus TaxID=2704463 RepID=A0A6C0NX26_9BACL|nr:S-layer homology domain-containing protein [Paenibacillus rhizovicinus]QHW30728.1 hypothetical protein GZH47_07575 [Paenibacillus rhizovicinus]